MRAVRGVSGEPPHRIEYAVEPTGDGLTVTMTGGTRPHIGAVAIAVPRPSLADPRAVSATTSVYTLIGHKDDELAKTAADLICRSLNCVTVVVAGFHLNDATPADIRQVMDNAQRAAREIVMIFEDPPGRPTGPLPA